jgi:hypothetical protein
MAYRGNDLNLRSLVGRPWRESGEAGESVANGGWMQAVRSRGEDPILVDELVIACCNAAHDAALFHGAREVRLEHLLYGLARLQAAAEILEQLGLRTAQLRRETAMAIAADVAAGPISDNGAPRASAEFDEVLHRAAELARERLTLASVPDVLRALLGWSKTSPANALLTRAAVDPGALDRWREEARQAITAEMEGKSLRPHMAEAVLSRLDMLDGALRSLQSEMAADRQAMGELLGEVKRGIAARREDVARVLAAVARDHLQAVATSVEGKLDALANSLAALSERAVLTGEVSAPAPREDLVARLGAIEERIAAHNLDDVKALPGTMAERLDHSDKIVQGFAEAGAHNWRAASEQMQALQTTVETQLEDSAETAKARQEDLGEIYAALVKLGTNQQTLGNNLNTWRMENSGDVSIISNRLETMEKMSQDVTGRLSDQLRSLREDIAAAASRASGFKRWFHGSNGSVGPRWRDRATSLRASLRRAGRRAKS